MVKSEQEVQDSNGSLRKKDEQILRLEKSVSYFMNENTRLKNTERLEKRAATNTVDQDVQTDAEGIGFTQSTDVSSQTEFCSNREIGVMEGEMLPEETDKTSGVTTCSEPLASESPETFSQVVETVGAITDALGVMENYAVGHIDLLQCGCDEFKKQQQQGLQSHINLQNKIT